MYIQNRRDGSKFNDCITLQLHLGLMSLKPAIAHICIYLSVIEHNMKENATILLILLSLSLFATEQSPDILIYKSDTIFIDTYPLENLMESDSLLKKKIFENSDEICMSSGCWRGHVATWKIENDSLFLIKLINGCEDFEFKLENVFGEKNVENNQVFANWFSGDLNASFEEYLYFDPLSWEDIYSKSIKCRVLNGKVEIINITEKSDCEKASILAQKDFENSNYSFHSEAFSPSDNTYLYVLRNYFNIGWYFLADSLEHYTCYDSVIIKLLEEKHGGDFLNRAKIITDSLEQTKNWRKDASFPGGQKELFKFIYSNLNVEQIALDAEKTKVFVQIEIDSTGRVFNPKIMRGINKRIDNRVIEVMRKMPNWEPAYLYGKRIRQYFTIPIKIE